MGSSRRSTALPRFAVVLISIVVLAACGVPTLPIPPPDRSPTDADLPASDAANADATFEEETTTPDSGTTSWDGGVVTARPESGIVH
jgi:hypothetical protein